MGKKGKIIFDKNIDAVLSNRIVKHTEMSELSTQLNNSNRKKRLNPALLSVFFLFSAILLASYSFYKIFTKKV